MITGSPWQPKHPSAPPISDVQAEALDIVELKAKKHGLTVTYRAGDLVFLNNHAILHSREAFQDSPKNKRYLMRMWLRNDEKAWSLPEELQIASERTYENVDKEEEIWEIDPYLTELTGGKFVGRLGRFTSSG
jgi:TfdA family taurine catabolism dioxygenase TauD